MERTSTCGEKPWDSNGHVQELTRKHTCVKREAKKKKKKRRHFWTLLKFERDR